MSKKFHHFSEDEIATVVNQLPIYIAQWMRETGIRPGPDINGGDDFYEPVKRLILEQWEKARVLHSEDAD